MKFHCNSTDWEYAEVYPAFQIPITVFCALFIVVGVTGNILVLTTILKFPRLRTFSNALLANLAVADLGTLFTGFTTLLLGLYGHVVLRDNAWICQSLLHFTFLFIFTSVLTLQTIAVDRYLIITRLRGVYNLYYRRWRIWALVGGTWVIGIAMTEFSLFSTFVCGDAYMEPLHVCYIDVDNPVSMATMSLVITLSCVLCMVTIPLFYGLTFRKIRSARMRSRSPTVNSVTSTAESRGFSREERAVTKMVAIVYVAYVICWSPMLLTHVTYFAVTTPSYKAHYVGALLALGNSSINPLIYTGVNRSFRESFLTILRRRRDSPPESTAGVTISMNIPPIVSNPQSSTA